MVGGWVGIDNRIVPDYSVFAPQSPGNTTMGRRWKNDVDPTLEPGDPGFQLLNHRFPSRIATGHLAVVGAPGSGKTLVRRLIWQSVIPRLSPGQGALIMNLFAADR